ncbi:hypothetical protein [Pseudolysinimonas sp.]|uniref:hypothetical protein n=1 Tax=Pseudolysinimonas sp. TaxID=2680009 RepID=UPI00286A74A0|nr:hypothetical protein [Pseudolysinimonas sp.]
MILIPIVFAALFALALFGPISNLGALPAVYEAYGIGDAVPWPVLVLAVVLPPVLYLVGLLLGRGRRPFARALILTVALAASFALYFGIVSLVGAIQPPITL